MSKRDAKRYVLCRLAVGAPGQIDISEAEFLNLKNDVKALVEVAGAEEKFAAFIDNYFEFEQGLLQEALHSMIYNDYLLEDPVKPKNTVNRRLLNLLTTVKLYLDSYPQHAKSLLPVGDGLEDLKEAPSRAYDRSLGYRVMEALRNYGQHESFPIHGWTVHHWWDESTEPSLHRASVNPILRIEELAASKKFKKAVVAELEGLDKPIELKPFAREYIEQLGAVHEEFRKATSALVREATDRIEHAVSRFVTEFPGSRKPIVALPVDERGLRAGDPVYLSAVVMEHLPRLKRRIGLLANYSKRRVEY
jgi:hypothetical protein